MTISATKAGAAALSSAPLGADPPSASDAASMAVFASVLALLTPSPTASPPSTPTPSAVGEATVTSVTTGAPAPSADATLPSAPDLITALAAPGTSEASPSTPLPTAPVQPAAPQPPTPPTSSAAPATPAAPTPPASHLPPTLLRSIGTASEPGERKNEVGEPTGPAPQRGTRVEQAPLAHPTIEAAPLDAPAAAPPSPNRSSLPRPDASRPSDPPPRSPSPVIAGAVALGPAPTPVASVRSSGAGPASIEPRSETTSIARQLQAEVAPLRDLGDGHHELHIDLHPAELGRVGLDVHVAQGTVHVAIHAEEPGSHSLLRHALPELRAALEQAGIATGDLVLADRQPGQRAPHTPPAESTRTDRPGVTALEPTVPIPPQSTTSSDVVDLLL